MGKIFRFFDLNNDARAETMYESMMLQVASGCRYNAVDKKAGTDTEYSIRIFADKVQWQAPGHSVEAIEMALENPFAHWRWFPTGFTTTVHTQCGRTFCSCASRRNSWKPRSISRRTHGRIGRSSRTRRRWNALISCAIRWLLDKARVSQL